MNSEQKPKTYIVFRGWKNTEHFEDWLNDHADDYVLDKFSCDLEGFIAAVMVRKETENE